MKIFGLFYLDQLQPTYKYANNVFGPFCPSLIPDINQLRY